MKYMLEYKGYEVRGFERVNYIHSKVRLYVVNVKNNKIIDVYGPELEKTLQVLKLVIDVLAEENFELEKINYVVPAYFEELVDIGEEGYPMWHIYLRDKEQNSYLALATYINSRKDVEKAIKHLCKLN